jgi:hypothetical protein
MNSSRADDTTSIAKQIEICHTYQSGGGGGGGVADDVAAVTLLMTTGTTGRSKRR